MGWECKCRRRCYDKINKAQRQVLHDEFRNGQDQLITNTIIEVPKSRTASHSENTKPKAVFKKVLNY